MLQRMVLTVTKKSYNLSVKYSLVSVAYVDHPETRFNNPTVLMLHLRWRPFSLSTCSLPNKEIPNMDIHYSQKPSHNPELLKRVNKQVRRHSHTCGKKKSKTECRFNYQQPPMKASRSIGTIMNESSSKKLGKQ